MCATRRWLSEWRCETAMALPSQRRGEAGGSLSRGSVARVGAASTKSRRPGTAGWGGGGERDGKVYERNVRHQALVVRMEVGDRHGSVFMVAGRRWWQPKPWAGGEGGSSLAEVASSRHCRMGRAR